MSFGTNQAKLLAGALFLAQVGMASALGVPTAWANSHCSAQTPKRNINVLSKAAESQNLKQAHDCIDQGIDIGSEDFFYFVESNLLYPPKTEFPVKLTEALLNRYPELATRPIGVERKTLLDMMARPLRRKQDGQYANRTEYTIVDRLLQAGADATINAADMEGYNPLLQAAESCNPDLVKLFLDHRAKVNVRESTGKTPLLLAAESCKDSTGSWDEIGGHDAIDRSAVLITNLLIGHGAKINERYGGNDVPFAPLDWFVRNNMFLATENALKNGADVNGSPGCPDCETPLDRVWGPDVHGGLFDLFKIHLTTRGEEEFSGSLRDLLRSYGGKTHRELHPGSDY